LALDVHILTHVVMVVVVVERVRGGAVLTLVAGR
jgi:hypothetical protein